MERFGFGLDVAALSPFSVFPMHLLDTIRFSDNCPKDIVETAVADRNLSTLIGALEAAGLMKTLKGGGPFTVFAPTDDAFKKLPKRAVEEFLNPANKFCLVRILLYHVIPGKFLAAEVVKLSKAKTLEGSELRISVNDGKVMVDDASVLRTDMQNSNGVIRVIDSVLLPE